MPSGPQETLLENAFLPPPRPLKPADSDAAAVASAAGASITDLTSESSVLTAVPEVGNAEHHFETDSTVAALATQQAAAGVFVTAEGTAVGEGQSAPAEAATVGVEFVCGAVLEREYELEKVGSL